MAGFSNTIKAELGLNTGPFERGMRQAEGVAGKAGKAIEQKLGGGQAFRSVVLALGISVESIAQNIARAITGMSKAAEESLGRIVAASERAKAATLRIIDARQTPDQKLEANRREQAGLLRENERLSAKTKQVGGTRGGKRTVSGVTEEDRAMIAENIARMNELREAENKLVEQLTNARLSEFFDGVKHDAEELARIEEERWKASREAESGLLEQIQAEADARGQALLAENEMRNEAIENEKELAKATAKATGEQQRLNQALRDQSGATFSQVLGGERGSATDRAKARRSDQLLRRAQRIRDIGAGEFRDENGKVVDKDQFADSLVSKANSIRGSIGALRSDETDPLAAYKSALKDAEALLERIAENLEPKEPTS